LVRKKEHQSKGRSGIDTDDGYGIKELRDCKLPTATAVSAGKYNLKNERATMLI
jgi:hypothetical protein